MIPDYLRNSLPPKSRPMYRQTSTNAYHEIPCRTTKFRNSFFPDASKTWNCLSNKFQGSLSLHKFKSNVISLVRPKLKFTFGIYFHIELKYLVQLCTKLSSLRCYKTRHNFDDTPYDLCVCLCGVEDTPHFLFDCLLHS